MMNKALEVIEAHFLFELEPEQIEVVVHPESIVHSMVQFIDGSTVAQMSPPDMRLPIAYALSYPERLHSELPRTEFGILRKISFEPPDGLRFPAIRLGHDAIKLGGLAALRLNSANEVAVAAFLAGRARFTDISSVVSAVMVQPVAGRGDSLEGLLEADKTARASAEQLLASGTLNAVQGL
jgi:1-deoxy-D-xylulose-5-phosphate reductoisomerase